MIIQNPIMGRLELRQKEESRQCGIKNGREEMVVIVVEGREF